MTLATELTNDPLSRGYTQFIPDSPGVLADMMNIQIYSMPKEKFVSARGVLAAHGSAGAAILDKLEAASTSVSEIKWAFNFLKTDSGIDVGHPVTRALIDQLAGSGVLTTAEATMIKDMAIQPASRTDVLGLPYVREADIRAALAA
jgi:hypothetical protein